MTQSITRAIRGNFFDISGIADAPNEIESLARYIEDGMMFLSEGKIAWLGSRAEGEQRLLDTPYPVPLDDYRDKLIVPGFIDTHIHYPQTEMIGAYGEQLLEWLNNYTFPTEAQYHDIEYAKKMSQFFIEQLLNNGTTTALVFGTVHPQSVDALFTVAAALNMRLIAGKVMMDKHAPEALLETPEDSERETRTLIERWHNHKRLSYALTPRFVPTSSAELLDKVKLIKDDYPDIYLQTHLSENLDEISWVKSLYPAHERYLDVYHHHGLTGSRCVFAHCLHLEEEEWDCLRDTDSSIAFCPTSNLFWAAAYLTSRHRGRRKCGLEWARMSGLVPPLTCCKRWVKLIRSGSCNVIDFQPLKPFITPRWVARARCILTIKLVISTLEKRPIWWCSTQEPPRFSSCAAATVKRWQKSCLC